MRACGPVGNWDNVSIPNRYPNFFFFSISHRQLQNPPNLASTIEPRSEYGPSRRSERGLAARSLILRFTIRPPKLDYESSSRHWRQASPNLFIADGFLLCRTRLSVRMSSHRRLSDRSESRKRTGYHTTTFNLPLRSISVCFESRLARLSIWDQ